MTRNPKNLSWADPSTYEDGSPFGAADFKAYELGASQVAGGQPTEALLSLPVALGVGTAPIPDAVKSVRGPQFLYLRTLDVSDQFSVWSNGVEVLFTGRPSAPTFLVAS